MTSPIWQFARFVAARCAAAIRNALALLAHRGGSSAVIFALSAPALIGAMGLAAEVSFWHLHHRALQNAADAAAIAAATNASSTYAAEAKAVAAQYGFQDGANNIAVAVANPATASGCTANCYTVTVSDAVPLFLSQVVGFQGDATVNGRPVTTISATSVATDKAAYPYCLLALASSGAQGITSNGAPKANLNGCNTMSDTGSTCNGHNLNATFGDAHGTNNGCGNTQRSNVAAVSDPYSGLASSIPTNPCSSYPQEPAKKNDPALPAANQWSGSYSLSGDQVVCGDQQLTGNTAISAANGATLVIENGQLDTNGYTLTGANLTVVFTGTNSSSYQYAPTGGGTLDIAAPTSGAWSGVAIYQDPSLTNGVNISAAWKQSHLEHQRPHLPPAFQRNAQRRGE